MPPTDLDRAPFRTRIDDVAFALCLAIFAVALAAFAGSAIAGTRTPAEPAAAKPGRQQQVGTFTGDHVNGAPVYRLPAISVTAKRIVER